MKSIRLSLVAYFLILLTGALGAVSWLVYRTTSRTLYEKEHSTVVLVESNCKEEIKALHDAFDQRLLAEAEKLASLSRETAQHNEFYYPFGMLAAPPMPMAHLCLPMWVWEGAHPALVGRLDGNPVWIAGVGTIPTTGGGSWLSEATSDILTKRLRRKGADAPNDPDDPASEKAADRSHQYLQIDRPLYKYEYQNQSLFRPAKIRGELLQQLRKSLIVSQYSESLGNHHLPMVDLEMEDHHFDEVVLPTDPATKLRRVLIKRTGNFPRSGRGISVGPQGQLQVKVWCLNYGPPLKEKGVKEVQKEDLKQLIYFEREREPPKDGKFTKGKVATPPKTYYYWEYLPFVFIHYAEDVSVLEPSVLRLQTARDEKLAALALATQNDLEDLRRQLGWIGLATFFSILIGSLLLISLGLAPLSRLSDAISKVTPRDFRLKMDPRKLPKELAPIAGRMSDTLDQLGKAFAREKQAAADISHELRTPLAALLTTAEVGLKKPRSPEEYRELLQDCRLSGEHMMQLVERLLALARLDANADRLRSAPVDVGDLAQQCADMVRPLAEARGLELQVHAGPSLAVQADGGKLREVLTNLLHNAIQYNKPDGSIDLTVERQNGHLLMQVRDTGIGISPEAREHIFERFYRADPSRHSDTPHAGLGLAIVKSYIDLMGGRIEVDSSSAGSTFRIEVPAIDIEVPATSFKAVAARF